MSEDLQRPGLRDSRALAERLLLMVLFNRRNDSGRGAVTSGRHPRDRTRRKDAHYVWAAQYPVAR